MKIISFSLYGSKALYCKGAIENSLISKEIYPDWKCRFYIDNTVPSNVVEQLKNNDAEIVLMNEQSHGHTGMFWRFLTLDDPNLEYMISRDCDSRLTSREAVAVKEWIDSGRLFHCMHDNQSHGTEILGGMWGSKKLPNFNAHETLKLFGDVPAHGSDQIFLTRYVYPIIKNDCIRHITFLCEHCRYYGGDVRYFPAHEPMKYGKYVGEVIPVEE